MQNNAQQTARVGLFFLLGVALIWVAFETLSDGKVFKDRGYSLIAGFPDLKELKIGDEVRMAGVKIGSVEETRLTPSRAEAVLRIQPGIEIRKDATATILQAGLLGTNYIGVTLGTPNAPLLSQGDQITTKVTADINAIMAQLGELGSKLDDAFASIGDAMKGKDGQPGLFQRLDTLLADNGAKINETMSNLQSVTAKLNSGDGTLGKLINDPKLHDELVATLGDIKTAAENAKGFMANAQSIVDQVKSGKGTLGALVFDDQAGQNIRVVSQNLREISEKISRGEGTLGKLISDDGLYRDAQGTLKKVDRIVEGMSDQGPITAVGVVANSLF